VKINKILAKMTTKINKNFEKIRKNHWRMPLLSSSTTLTECFLSSRLSSSYPPQEQSFSKIAKTAKKIAIFMRSKITKGLSAQTNHPLSRFWHSLSLVDNFFGLSRQLPQE
jgi:hypothetical protein